jgi:DNA-binding MarR family transcriptional regulator
MATPAKRLDDRIEELMLPNDHKSVLRILVTHESMPFLELSSLIDIDDQRLSEIVDELEREGIVKVTSRGNILDEIVTLKEPDLALASNAP